MTRHSTRPLKLCTLIIWGLLRRWRRACRCQLRRRWCGSSSTLPLWGSSHPCCNRRRHVASNGRNTWSAGRSRWSSICYRICLVRARILHAQVYTRLCLPHTFSATSLCALCARRCDACHRRWAGAHLGCAAWPLRARFRQRLGRARVPAAADGQDCRRAWYCPRLGVFLQLLPLSGHVCATRQVPTPLILTRLPRCVCYIRQVPTPLILT